MARASRVAIGAVLAAVLLHAPSEARPPTAGQLERATDRFLAARPASPARPGGSGGIGGAQATGALLPEQRVVAFYGAPQMSRTVLGLNSITAAARKLAAQASPFADLGDRPVIGEFDLVSVFATAGRGPDGLYRSVQDDAVIEAYLEQARAIGARLMLDIQPGRSTFQTEVEGLAEWVAQPDVDVALDPEWNVGRRGIPGQTPGKVRSREVNSVSRALAGIVRTYDLPPKLLVVHQFRRGMVRGRGRIKQRPGVQVVLNFDGIGAPGPKASGYEALSQPGIFSGFSIFYERDAPLMKPSQILGLDPEPDLLLYQ